MARWAAPWVERLVAEAMPGPENVMHLPGSWLDAVPANMIRDHSGSLVDIDLEWGATTPVPLAWVLVRGLVAALAASPISPAFSGLTFRDGVSKILEPLGQPPSEEDYRIAAVFEDSLQDMVGGRNQTAPAFAELLACSIYSVTSSPTFQQEIAELHKEIARVKATISWRITKPLRLLAFILRHLSK